MQPKGNATQRLHDLGQSIWLDNITRDLLTSGTLKRYIDELSVTGLTSNPTIFNRAIKNSASHDAAIREKLKVGKSGEKLFFEMALDDLGRAADLFRPIHNRTNGVDGVGVPGSVPFAGPRHGEHSRRGQGSARKSRAAEPFDQDPRHQRRPSSAAVRRQDVAQLTVVGEGLQRLLGHRVDRERRGEGFDLEDVGSG